MSELLMGIPQDYFFIGEVVFKGELAVAERVGGGILFEGDLPTMGGSLFHQIEL